MVQYHNYRDGDRPSRRTKSHRNRKSLTLLESRQFLYDNSIFLVTGGAPFLECLTCLATPFGPNWCPIAPQWIIRWPLEPGNKTSNRRPLEALGEFILPAFTDRTFISIRFLEAWEIPEKREDPECARYTVRSRFANDITEKRSSVPLGRFSWTPRSFCTKRALLEARQPFFYRSSHFTSS